MVYSYFNFAKWGVGDTFNLAIGQGENAYNPSQVVRYVAALANGGYLVNLNVVNKVETSNGKVAEVANRRLDKISFKDTSNLNDIKIGMVNVSTQGLAKDAFGSFPIKVATKTGTAEKSGKIPTDKEYDYLMSHLSSYSLDKTKVLERYNKLKSDRERELTNEKIKDLKAKINDTSIDSDKRKKYQKELEAGIKVKLDDTDKVNAQYLRRAIKQLNSKITDEDIDKYKEDYSSFAWCVAYAPADNPKIAVACMIPQGETSSYAVLPIRETMAQYFGLIKEGQADEKN